jgi:NB-ARC domain
MQRKFLRADRLLSHGKVTCVGIVGMPGIGKKTVAKALLKELQHSFETRIITVGREPDEQELLSRVWNEMKPDENLPLELTKGRFDADQACKTLCEIIRAKTKTRPTLLLLDDVWTARQVQDLDFVTLYGGANRLVVTTRDERTLDERDPEAHDCEWVPALSDDNACKLLCYHAFRCEEPGQGYEEYVPKC